MFSGRREFIVLWTIVVSIALSACHDPDKFQLQGPSNLDGTLPSALLDVVSQATSIPANGGSRTRIEARIDPASSVHTVTFETTKGVLFAGSKTTATTPVMDVNVDTNGVAVAELQSATEPGTARVTVKIAIPKTTPTQHLSQSVDITFTPVNVGEMITLVASPASADADGATLIRLVATVSPTLPAASRTVTFKTTGGKFTNPIATDERTATVTADAGHTAFVDLIAPVVAGQVNVTATVSNSSFSAQATLAFSKALPDVVFVQFAQGSVTAVGADVANITVTLLRNIGQVADNTVVSYSAVDSAGTKIGAFEKLTLARVVETDPGPQKRVMATADFNPDDTAALGVATVTVTVGSRTGTATITIE